MNLTISVPLTTTPDQFARLLALQAAFAEVCNALAPTVRDTRVWNRVALHHMAYKALRDRFPAIGSQMVCNAIYSVSRACRTVFQTPGSPFHLSNLTGRPLPLLRFSDTSPVYFDRHTLSLKQGQASMYTLDGRMRFQLALRPQDEKAFHERKLLEIILQRRGPNFELSFVLAAEAPELENLANVQQNSQAMAAAMLEPAPAEPDDSSLADESAHPAAVLPGPSLVLPDYVRIESNA
jgi:hypothetical protein